MLSQSKIIVEGITQDGEAFRPSDWMERICGSLGTFGTDRRMRYAHEVQPQIIDGVKCLVVDPALERNNRTAYEFLMEFASSNRLRVHKEHEETAEIEMTALPRVA